MDSFVTVCCIVCYVSLFLYKCTYAVCLAEDISKHRIFWEEPKGTTAGPILVFDGVPFVINSTTVLDCQHGKIRGKRQSSVNADKVSECICVLEVVYTAQQLFLRIGV